MIAVDVFATVTHDVHATKVVELDSVEIADGVMPICMVQNVIGEYLHVVSPNEIRKSARHTYRACLGRNGTDASVM